MKVKLPAAVPHGLNALGVIPHGQDLPGQTVRFAVMEGLSRAGFNVRHNVAPVHNGQKGDALHHVAVGLAGHAQPRGPGFQGNEGGAADLQGVPVVLTVKVA